jgi:DNA-binding FadR family transcriptional regulator
MPENLSIDLAPIVIDELAATKTSKELAAALVATQRKHYDELAEIKSMAMITCDVLGERIKRLESDLAFQKNISETYLGWYQKAAFKNEQV